jgi:hypothetical protein
MLATAALWVRIQASQKYKIGEGQRSDQHSLTRQKNKTALNLHNFPQIQNFLTVYIVVLDSSAKITGK